MDVIANIFFVTGNDLNNGKYKSLNIKAREKSTLLQKLAFTLKHPESLTLPTAPRNSDLHLSGAQ
jgi:hypothetical protein